MLSASYETALRTTSPAYPLTTPRVFDVPKKVDRSRRAEVTGEINKMIDDLNFVLGLAHEYTGLFKVSDFYPIPQVRIPSGEPRFEHEIHFTMDRLVDAQMLGLIEWLSNDSCRFFYPTVETERETAGRRFREVHKHYVNYEELKDAKRLPVSVRNLGKQFKTLDEHFPERLRPLSYIVTGTTVYEQRIVKQTKEMPWVPMQPAPPLIYDPALVIGNYVICGWKD